MADLGIVEPSLLEERKKLLVSPDGGRERNSIGYGVPLDQLLPWGFGEVSISDLQW